MNTAIFAVFVSFAISAALGKLLIPYLIRLKFGQQIREDGPAHHHQKAGTPTMGGIMIIAGFVPAALIFARHSPEAMAVMLAAVGFGIVGFLDDFIKIKRKRNLGLRAYQKLIGQVIISALFILFWQTLPRYTTAILIPFFVNHGIDLGPVFPAFACLVFISSANGSNLTDGLDGLAAGVTAIIAVFFMIASEMWALNSPVYPVIGAFIGALLGFLLYNSHPAKVYMGDTGSLALGGFVAATALIMGMPLFLVIVAVIYVIESVSVIIQVGYFKLTKKRFFKMAPIHHAFELHGWPETKIVALFYIITALACLAGLVALMGV